MANVNHNTLTDPYLHEPKGASTALAGQIYVADGAGSGAWVENSRSFNGYLSFSTGSPYNHTTTTSDTAINPSFTVGINNGFTGLSSPNARVRYDGTESINAVLDARFSIAQTSGTSKDIQMSFFKNGVEVSGSRMVASTTTTEWHLISLSSTILLETDDYIEVFIKANANVTVSFASGLLHITGIAA